MILGEAISPLGSEASAKEPITANSEPVYDHRWPWLADDAWTCLNWQTWHSKLKEQYGLAQANEIWTKAWDEQSAWTYPYSWCKYDSQWRQYLIDNQIDPDSYVSRVVVPVFEAGGNVADALKTTSSSLKGLLPLALIIVVVGVGYMVYRAMKDGKQIPIPGLKLNVK
jgi:hypothetical protein